MEFACLATLVALHCGASESQPPDTVALVNRFDPAAFAQPPAEFWPGPFWLLNGPLEPEKLAAQLRDMNAHGMRSVCPLPMPHEFRPDTTNNLLEPGYLTDAFFERLGGAADVAASLGMQWWLYDEGGWPSGQATGQVTKDHPELKQHRLEREHVDAGAALKVPDDALVLIVESPSPKQVRPGETWTPTSPQDSAYLYRIKEGGYVDMFNPATTPRFIELTHEGYKRAMGKHFGQTVKFAFTDEPNAATVNPGKSIGWTPGFEKQFRERYNEDLLALLPALFKDPKAGNLTLDDMRARVRFYDFWSARFRECYFEPLRTWCRKEGLASGGHLNGEDETVYAARYGYGHALRQLRAMDVPGVDVIWRQLFPTKPEHHFFPKYASTAAHQLGVRYAFSESFCVYGNGLTPAQMKWVIDYQYVRGINLLVVGCLPFITLDHHMTGERPHFGPADPMWDHLQGFFGYTARLGYAMSVGRPRLSAALYYPVRDIWANGEGEHQKAVQTHDALADSLLRNQCDFDLIDDDLLASDETRVTGGYLITGAMAYDTVLCGKTAWMLPASRAKLVELAKAGGHVLCVDSVPGVDGNTAPEPELQKLFQVGSIAETADRSRGIVTISPPCEEIRAAGRKLRNGDEILLLFNEGTKSYQGSVDLDAKQITLLDPLTGNTSIPTVQGRQCPVTLAPGETMLAFIGVAAGSRPEAPSSKALPLDALLAAKPTTRIRVGEHDFEHVPQTTEPVPFAQASAWNDWLGVDYSGEVEYRAVVDIPQEWAGKHLRLETGEVQYAATVYWDGKPVGQLLWTPWRVDLPEATPGRHELIIRVANTLANELVSDRVTKAWADKKGPGWPSPYHARALVFERESLGGGLAGPVTLTCE